MDVDGDPAPDAQQGVIPLDEYLLDLPWFFETISDRVGRLESLASRLRNDAQVVLQNQDNGAQKLAALQGIATALQSALDSLERAHYPDMNNVDFGPRKRPRVAGHVDGDDHPDNEDKKNDEKPPGDRWAVMIEKGDRPSAKAILKRLNGTKARLKGPVGQLYDVYALLQKDGAAKFAIWLVGKQNEFDVQFVQDPLWATYLPKIKKWTLAGVPNLPEFDSLQDSARSIKLTGTRLYLDRAFRAAVFLYPDLTKEDFVTLAAEIFGTSKLRGQRFETQVREKWFPQANEDLLRNMRSPVSFVAPAAVPAAAPLVVAPLAEPMGQNIP